MYTSVHYLGKSEQDSYFQVASKAMQFQHYIVLVTKSSALLIELVPYLEKLGSQTLSLISEIEAHKQELSQLQLDLRDYKQSIVEMFETAKGYVHDVERFLFFADLGENEASAIIKEYSKKLPFRCSGQRLHQWPEKV